MPESASGERLARSSIATRSSSSQSMSSGASVTSPSSSPSSASIGFAIASTASRFAPSPRKRLSRRESPFAIFIAPAFATLGRMRTG